MICEDIKGLEEFSKAQRKDPDKAVSDVNRNIPLLPNDADPSMPHEHTALFEVCSDALGYGTWT